MIKQQGKFERFIGYALMTILLLAIVLMPFACGHLTIKNYNDLKELKEQLKDDEKKDS